MREYDCVDREMIKAFLMDFIFNKRSRVEEGKDKNRAYLILRLSKKLIKI